LGYAIPDEKPAPPPPKPVSHVSCIFFGAAPKLTDMKSRHTITLDRLVKPNELHKQINAFIPGATVTVLGPSSTPTDLVFINLPQALPIDEFLFLVNKIMEDLH